MTQKDRIIRYGLVAVILFAILGSAYIVSEKAGLDLVGSGGINAKLLPKVGDEAPELFTLTTDGQPVQLSALKGYPVWINFWGSWCQPCRAEMPEVEAAYKTLSAEGVVMLGVNQGESPQDALAYAKDAGITFPILIDPKELAQVVDLDSYPFIKESVQGWQVNNWPTHIFIDRDGIVKAVVIEPLTYEKAIAYGEMILPGTPPAMPPATPVGSPEATPAA
jgi:peroxiredoxin